MQELYTNMNIDNIPLWKQQQQQQHTHINMFIQKKIHLNETQLWLHNRETVQSPFPNLFQPPLTKILLRYWGKNDAH